MSSVIVSSYSPDCQLLKALARVLDLPAVATTTAFTYLHRIRCSEHPCNLSSQELVAACIYVAAKAEEVNVSANHLINSARVLSQRSQQQLLQALAPLDLQPTLPAGTDQQHAATLAGAEQQPAVAAASAGDAAQQHVAAPVAAAEGQAGVQQQQQQQQESQQLPQPEADALSIVTGDDYYAAKDRLFIAEQDTVRG
ncbi:hypothetical protein OEZ86_006894 [Tetradesmus obliquus]|nr:hypothetical protein OEZ86_006894 [Tetradesmus obliquus]